MDEAEKEKIIKGFKNPFNIQMELAEIPFFEGDILPKLIEESENWKVEDVKKEMWEKLKKFNYFAIELNGKDQPVVTNEKSVSSFACDRKIFYKYATERNFNFTDKQSAEHSSLLLLDDWHKWNDAVLTLDK